MAKLTKLTQGQKNALSSLGRYVEITAYGAGFRLDTLGALERKGLATASCGLGSITFPRSSIKWRITEAGRRALEEA